MTPQQITEQLKESLQGNMREIIGTLELKPLNNDRDGFSDQVMKKASPDMAKLGIEIISCNIQNVTDKEGAIKDLGADNLARIKKDAAINRANAERDVAIETAKAEKESNDARVEADTAIAVKNNDLALKKAALKKQADTAQADKYGRSIMGVKNILKTSGIYIDAKHPVVLSGTTSPRQASLNF